MTDLIETALADFDSILRSTAFSDSQKQGFALLAVRNKLLTKPEHIRYAVKAGLDRKQYKTAVDTSLTHFGYSDTLRILLENSQYSTAARLARDQKDYATASRLYERAGRFDRAVEMARKSDSPNSQQRAEALFERTLGIIVGDLIDAINEGDIRLAANQSYQAGKLCYKSEELDAACRHFKRSKRLFEQAGDSDAAYDLEKALAQIGNSALLSSAQSDISNE